MSAHERPQKLAEYGDRAILLEGTVSEQADGTPVCTMYPWECDAADAPTHWITATGDAFSDLESKR